MNKIISTLIFLLFFTNIALAELSFDKKKYYENRGYFKNGKYYSSNYNEFIENRIRLRCQHEILDRLAKEICY